MLDNGSIVALLPGRNGLLTQIATPAQRIYVVVELKLGTLFSKPILLNMLHDILYVMFWF